MLAASVETATLNFLEKGDKIAKESQFLKDELTAAVDDVRKQGTHSRYGDGGKWESWRGGGLYWVKVTQVNTHVFFYTPVAAGSFI